MKKIKIIFSVLVAYMPFGLLRVFLWNKLFQYNIESSNIGYGTVIICKSFSIKNSKIGRFNIFKGPFSISIAEGSVIGSNNNFHCGDWVENFSHFERRMIIGTNVMISNKHYFDVTGLINIDSKTWIAGIETQLWTHSGDKKDVNIFIGKDCYIGSRSCFVPGVSILDNTLVGMGSVVSKKFVEEYVLIAGNPAVVKKNKYNWKTDLK